MTADPSLTNDEDCEDERDSDEAVRRQPGCLVCGLAIDTVDVFSPIDVLHADGCCGNWAHYDCSNKRIEPPPGCPCGSARPGPLSTVLS